MNVLNLACFTVIAAVAESSSDNWKMYSIVMEVTMGLQPKRTISIGRDALI
jgi:hypothetical protein